MTNKLYS